MILIVAFTAALTASQMPDTASSALPRLAFDSLPPPVRADLEGAYEHARGHPGDALAVGRLAMMLHAYEQFRSAEVCYRGARQLDPQSLSWAHLQGVVQAELGDNPAAVGSFRQALAIEPNYLSARVRLAEALMRVGELDGSRAEYETLLRDFPELALAHHGLGRVSSIRGDANAAREHYHRAVDVTPQFGAAHYALALLYREAGLADRAQAHLDAYRKLGARRPAPPDPLLDQVRSLKATARDLIADGARLGAEGRLDESIALHLKALKADPTAAQAHVNLISLYGRMGQPQKAEEHYGAALALENNLADAHYNYGVMLAAAHHYVSAAEAFRQTLDVHPFHAQAHNNLAALLADQGKLDEAAVHYRQALASDPQHRAARFNLGRVLVALGRPREAVEQFQKILLPEDAETPRYMYALANAWFAANDASKAREYGEEALRRAKALNQTELADRIEKELQRMRAVRR